MMRNSFFQHTYIFVHTKRVYTTAEEDLSSAVRADLATVQTENKGERQYKQGWSRLSTFQQLDEDEKIRPNCQEFDV